MNDSVQRCAECGSEHAPNVPPGLCPRCALNSVPAAGGLERLSCWCQKKPLIAGLVAAVVVTALAGITGWLAAMVAKDKAAAAVHALTAKAQADEEAARSEAERLEILHASDLFLAERALQTRDTNSARDSLAGLDAAVERQPTNAMLWCARAAVLRLMGDRERALAQFSRSIELASADLNAKVLNDALLRRSALLRELARGGEAGQDQRRAFDLPLARGGSQDALPDYQKAKEVSAELGQTNRELGLYFLSGSDSRHTLASTNGEEAQFFRAGWNYAYFFIDPTFKWELGSNVLIRVEYQLVQGKPIGLQYDGASDAFASATKRVRAPDGNWQVIEFILRDARFSNRQNLHADFRVYDNERGFYLKRVTVSRYERPPIKLGPQAFPPRDPAAGSNLIDLTQYYNVALTNSAQTGSPGNDLGALPPGVQTLGGIEFDVRGMVHLSSSTLQAKIGERYPAGVTNIPLNRKLGSIHVLHATGYAETNGTTIGYYTLRYASGAAVSLPIVYGRQIRDWWRTATERENTLGATVAWTGRNEAVAGAAGTLRLYRASFKNPRPEEEVASLDFVSAMRKSAPFLIAITVE